SRHRCSDGRQAPRRPPARRRRALRARTRAMSAGEPSNASRHSLLSLGASCPEMWRAARARGQRFCQEELRRAGRRLRILPAMATLTWLGHAAFRLESDRGKHIYVDPFLTGNPKAPDDAKRPERVDVIAITHGH